MLLHSPKHNLHQLQMQLDHYPLIPNPSTAILTPTTPPLQTSKAPTPTPIKDTKTSRNQGIILLRQRDLEAIYANSGPVAKSNEFQVHYWFLNLRHKASDGSYLDIAIPTTYFNYPQQVSSAHIDFEMSQVSDISDKALRLHNALIAKLLASQSYANLLSTFACTFDASSVLLGTMHRHPGGSAHQSFSGTDYMKTATNHGIVYPLETANETPSFSAIIAIDSGVCNLAHMEYRIANGTLGTDIHYEQGRCEAIVIRETPTISMVERMLGITEAAFYTKSVNSALDTTFVTLLSNIFRAITDEVDFTSTILVRPENVTAKQFPKHDFTGDYTAKPKTTTKPTKNKYAKLFLTDDEVDKLTKPQLIKHLQKIDRVIYQGYIEDYSDLSVAALRAEIKSSFTDLLNYSDDEAIIDNLDDDETAMPKPANTSSEYKRQILVDLGYDPFTVKNHTNATVDALYSLATE